MAEVPAADARAPEPPARAWTGPLGALAVVLVLALVPTLAAAFGQEAVTTLATRMLIFAIAAASLNLALGYAGLVSFGHAAYYGIGAYAVGILYAHASAREPLLGVIPGSDQLLVTLPAAMLAAGLAALALGALCLRTSGVQFIMITLAFAQMLFFLFVSLKAYGGDDGLIVRRRNALPGLNTRDDATFFYVCLAAGTLWFALLARIVRSRFGLVIGGIRQSERRMAAIGIPTYRYKLVAFAISGAGAGLAGALMANYARFVSPDMLHWTTSGELMIMVILGGSGTLVGPFLGAIAVIGLEGLLAAWTEHWQAVFGPFLILVVLFARGGLVGGIQAAARGLGRLARPTAGRAP